MPNSARHCGEENPSTFRHTAANANVVSPPIDDEGHGRIPRIKGAVFVILYFALPFTHIMVYMGHLHKGHSQVFQN